MTPEFAETLQQANEAPPVGWVNCVTCGIVGAFAACIAIAVCQNWQAIVGLFN